MAHELAPIDISQANAPSLAEVVEEVRRTNRPAVLRRADEDVAIISPVKKPAQRPRGKRLLPGPAEPAMTLTLEQVFGSVETPPHLKGNDIDELIRAAKEERAERLLRKL